MRWYTLESAWDITPGMVLRYCEGPLWFKSSFIPSHNPFLVVSFEVEKLRDVHVARLLVFSADTSGVLIFNSAGLWQNHIQLLTS